MGHLRLGRLPKTLRWQGVVNLLEVAPDDIPAVAHATATAAESRLRALGRDPLLGYCFWLLTRIAAASRESDFPAALERLDVPVPAADTAIGYISQLSEHVRAEVQEHPDSGPFGDMAALAFRRAFLETVGEHGRSLFGSSIEDVQVAFRSHATAARFGDLAARFFADFTSRTMRFFVEKELSNTVGREFALTTVADSAHFTEELDVYARQSARIMQGFASDWYSKHNWETQGEISPIEAQAFVAQALRKLRSELTRPDL